MMMWTVTVWVKNHPTGSKRLPHYRAVLLYPAIQPLLYPPRPTILTLSLCWSYSKEDMNKWLPHYRELSCYIVGHRFSILHSTLHWNDMNSANGTHRIFDGKKWLSSSHLIFSYFLLNKYKAETCNYDLGSKAYSFLPQTSPDSSRVWVCYLGGYIFVFWGVIYLVFGSLYLALPTPCLLFLCLDLLVFMHRESARDLPAFALL